MNPVIKSYMDRTPAAFGRWARHGLSQAELAALKVEMGSPVLLSEERAARRYARSVVGKTDETPLRLMTEVS